MTAASLAKARAVKAANLAARQAPAHNPERSRPARAEITAGARRRRSAGSLDRMGQMNLDIFSPDQLDPNYVYRWVNDEGSRLRLATKGDDYDYVNSSEIDGFDPDSTDSQNGERVRIIAGRDKQGGAVYTYLLKKPKAYFEADQQALRDHRAAMMEGRVYRGEVEDDESLSADAPHVYVPPEATLGSAGRRRGPVAA